MILGSSPLASTPIAATGKFTFIKVVVNKVLSISPLKSVTKLGRVDMTKTVSLHSLVKTYLLSAVINMSKVVTIASKAVNKKVSVNLTKTVSAKKSIQLNKTVNMTKSILTRKTTFITAVISKSIEFSVIKAINLKKSIQLHKFIVPIKSVNLYGTIEKILSISGGVYRYVFDQTQFLAFCKDLKVNGSIIYGKTIVTPLKLLTQKIKIYLR